MGSGADRQAHRRTLTSRRSRSEGNAQTLSAPALGIQSRQQLIIDLGRRENLSIRQLARHFAGARGHWQLIGTPSYIADELETRFRNSAADGFNIMVPLFPGGLEDVVAFVIPELRRRGLF